MRDTQGYILLVTYQSCFAQDLIIMHTVPAVLVATEPRVQFCRTLVDG